MAEDLNERDARLVQWLQEAHAKEAELEASLTQHIGLTQKASYKKRLQAHLKETKDHKRRVERRLKQLGGAPNGGGPLPGAVGEVAGKTVSLVKGQIGMARAVVTQQVETHLRNAQEELREEHVEIALYSRIETFATEVGDKDTAALAKAIRREEERMAKFLDSELGRLVKELVRTEVPRALRAGTPRRRTRRRTSTATSRSTGSRSTGSRSTGSRSTGSRSTGSRSSRSTGSRAKSGSATRRSSGRRTGSSGSTTRRGSSS